MSKLTRDHNISKAVALSRKLESLLTKVETTASMTDSEKLKVTLVIRSQLTNNLREAYRLEGLLKP